MKQKNIDILFVTDMKLFNEEYISNLENIGNISFCSKDNFQNEIISNLNDKVIIYDPDFGGWDFPSDIIAKGSNIKAIFLGTTDRSYIDLDLCLKNSIDVISIPRYASDSVAEYLVMYMFACSKKIPLQIKNNNKQDFTDEFLQMQLTGKKVGIVGLGNIGKKIADICNGIGMNVCYWNRTKKQTNYEYIDLTTLFKTCDVVYLCLQINDETKKIVTDDMLLSLKDNAIFISCTGKQLFNYKIIEEKISKKELFGYAIEEPDITLDKYQGNVMVTSEYGWFTKDAAVLRIDKWYNNVVTYICNLYNISVNKLLDSKAAELINENIIVKIRKAKTEDMRAILKLYEQENWSGDNNSAEKMAENYDYYSKHNYLLVAEYKNKIIGTITFSVNKAYAFNCMKYIVFDYLVVDSKYQRKRVGTQLIGALMSLAKKEGYESIWVVSSLGRNKAHEFYDYVGFNDPVKGFRKVFIKE